MPELPSARARRFVESYGLSTADALTLTAEQGVADYFETAIGESTSPDGVRLAANWIVNDLFGLQRARGLPADQLPLSVEQLRDLLAAVTSGELTGRAAKELLPQIEDGEMPRAAAARLNLLALEDDSALREAVEATIAAFPQAVDDYRGGKKAAIGRLIGETIRRTGGRARPDEVRSLLEETLEES
jgi:aspartyl-tRNA(Asn)/glutamyl-tRNA(Gln) amidotransferase subunit B